MSNETAPNGAIFVCAACGKTQDELYPKDDVLGGWDESCMLNAVLCKKDSLVYKDGRVIKADAYE
ncbi:MAG: hypothetical protein ACTSYO_08165 [Candidatus Ranarchaeia archaeon]